ncbi:MAG: hypothetical protein NVS4B9_15370 [Ktedonobacteraceae bacterium]
MIDFFNIAERNSAEIARRVVESVKRVYPDWHPIAFEKAFKEYREANRQGLNLNDPLARLYDTLTTDLDTLEERLANKKKHLIIFFDTFELIEEYPVIATLDPTQIFPDRYDFNTIGVVIAGRNPPDWNHVNWHGRQNEVRIVPINPFTTREMTDFINENRQFSQELEVDSSQEHKLYDLTQGRPILVGLVMDVLNYRVISLDNLLRTSPSSFEEYIVFKINELENPINWVVLFMAHIYHCFNHDMLDWLFEHVLNIQDLIEDVNTQNLWKRMLELSFVRRAQSGGDITLHDEMRRLVNKYNWPAHEQAGGIYRRELSRSIIEYYTQIIDTTTSSRARQNYIVEQLYHRLFVNWDEGFAFFEKTFGRAINLRQNAYARSLLQEVKTLRTHCHQLDDAMSWFKKGYNVALGIDSETEITSLNKQGAIYVQQGHIAEAIPLFQQARDRARETSDFYQQVEALVDLANALEKNGQSEQADQTLREAEGIATPYKYYYLLGLIENMRAEREYRHKNYQIAFSHFGQYCHHMLQFNPIEYEKAVRTTIERLGALPDADFKTEWSQLFDFWHDLNLAEKKSQMLDALEDVRDIMRG